MTSKYRKRFFLAFEKIVQIKKSGKGVSKKRLIKEYDLVNADFYLLACLADLTLTGEDFYTHRYQDKKNSQNQTQNHKSIYSGENDNTVSDGFGNAWMNFCHKCEQRSIEVVRPGKAQCINCG